ncbi:MAG: glycosyltransferase family 4 protein [Verrucomicrobiota bacterium]
MRILVHDYAGHPFQVQLSRALAAKGHEVNHAFASSLQTPRGELLRKRSDPARFTVTEVPMDPNYPRFKYSFRKRRNMEVQYGHEVARLIQEWKPDSILSANTPTETQQPIIESARKVGSRFAFWVQDFYSIAVDKLVRKKIPVIGRFVGGYYRYLDKRQLHQSDSVIAITEDFKPLLTKEFNIPEDKVAVIPNWAPIESLPVLPKVNSWAKSQELSHKFVFLYTGTLGMKHNPNLLLQLALKFKNHQDVQVVVVSEGIGAEWLKAEREKYQLKNLVLLPYQPFDELPKVLASGDVLISVLEEDAGVFSVPSKVLTYLCAQRPLLLAVPNVNLAARIIDSENAGLTVPPSDTQAFLHAAERFFENDAFRAEKAQNARIYAEKSFKIEEIVLKFDKILNNYNYNK